VASVDKLAVSERASGDVPKVQLNPYAVMRLSAISPREKSLPSSVPLKIVTPFPPPLDAVPVDVSSTKNAKAVVAAVVAAATTAKEELENAAPASAASPSATPNTSFRVYSPAEVAQLPMRPGYRLVAPKSFREELNESLAVAKAASPQKLAKWIASAVGATLLLFVFILVIANATDDTSSTTPTAAAAKSAVTAMAPPPPPPQLVPPPPPPAAAASRTDFELGDAPPQRTAVVAKPRAIAPKQGKRSVTIRNAPF